ncbi:MAG: phosphotransferase [Candidatus Peregrinibacteria bacterium]
MESEESAKAMIRNIFPQIKINEITLAGEGMDSRAYFVNGKMVFRFPKNPTARKSLGVEIALLPEIQKHVDLPTPSFQWIGREADTLLFAGYPRIPGEELSACWLQLTGKEQADVLHTLAQFFEQIHAFPVPQARALGVPEQKDRRIYKGDFVQVANDLHDLLPQKMEKFTSQLYDALMKNKRNFEYSPVLLQADFSPGHIFYSMKEQRVTGVIDFGDVGIGDPAFDLMYLYGYYGWAFIRHFLTYLPPSAFDQKILRKKLRWYLIHNTMEDIWMGQDRKNEEMKTWAVSLLLKQVQQMQTEEFY